MYYRDLLCEAAKSGNVGNANAAWLPAGVSSPERMYEPDPNQWEPDFRRNLQNDSC